jgi:hypothetical protein
MQCGAADLYPSLPGLIWGVPIQVCSRVDAVAHANFVIAYSKDNPALSGRGK